MMWGTLGLAAAALAVPAAAAAPVAEPEEPLAADLARRTQPAAASRSAEAAPEVLEHP